MGWFHWQCDETPWPRKLPQFRSIDAELPSSKSETIEVDRHGSPNLQAQLDHARRKPADTVICSALDGDPALRLNAAVANRQAEQVVQGVLKLAETAGAKRAWIAVEAGAPEPWIQPLRQAAKTENVQIVELANHYPQADPTLLIYTLTRRHLPPGRLPAECGVILVDAPAAVAFAGQTSHVPVGVHDRANCRSFYFDVPIGVTWREILAASDIATHNAILHAGDWPRDQRLDSSSLVGKGELTVHVSAGVLPVNPQSCIRCGWCVEVCPTQAHPALLLEAAQLGDAHRARRGRLAACIECGVCDQICPAHLPLLAAIRKIK